MRDFGTEPRGADKSLKLLVVGLNYAPDFIDIPKYTT
ncbi:hypothetical protein CC_2381 [Caulobacter vibrioides CB15]|uniref:Uncharacterized protein n=1 Tax=Caulobacter vibrioides (strain ATCC 19089 / CIP 103742 / CB 15) TaxID=190650 RepID=Q9A5R6_CAUVC|nr:hypothetical protein CC_2381 [Caulobacter vibrioides CB15]AVH77088.1 hypothetical protein CA607_20470 [Caulobacter vibrioides]